MPDDQITEKVTKFWQNYNSWTASVLPATKFPDPLSQWSLARFPLKNLRDAKGRKKLIESVIYYLGSISQTFYVKLL